MPSIKLDLYETGLSIDRFETREDWDRFMGQALDRRRRCLPEPRCIYPPSFPCVMLSDQEFIIEHRDFNDEYWNMFLPDGSYEIIED